MLGRYKVEVVKSFRIKDDKSRGIFLLTRDEGRSYHLIIGDINFLDDYVSLPPDWFMCSEINSYKLNPPTQEVIERDVQGYLGRALELREMCLFKKPKRRRNRTSFDPNTKIISLGY